MKSFIKILLIIVCSFITAQMFSSGFHAVNSSAADFYFFMGFISLTGAIYFMMGDFFDE